MIWLFRRWLREGDIEMNCSFDLFFAAERDAESYIDFHSHGGFEIVFYASGNGTTTIGNHTYSYSSGQFTVIPPGHKHDEYRRDKTKVMFVNFSYDQVPIHLQTGLYRDDPDGRIHDLLEKMAAELQSKNSFYHLKLNCLLTELIIEVGRIIGGDAPNETLEIDEKLRYAQNYIEQYNCDKVDFADLAETLGYSYHYFRHQFKEKTGYSPIQYVIRKRIDQAKKRLAGSSDSVTTIAMECGFSTPPQFCMLFKKYVGTSPQQYRNSKV